MPSRIMLGNRGVGADKETGQLPINAALMFASACRGSAP